MLPFTVSVYVVDVGVPPPLSPGLLPALDATPQPIGITSISSRQAAKARHLRRRPPARPKGMSSEKARLIPFQPGPAACACCPTEKLTVVYCVASPVRVTDVGFTLQVAVAGCTLQDSEIVPVELSTELMFTANDTPVWPPLTSAVDGPSMVKAAPLPESATTSGFASPAPLIVRLPVRAFAWLGEKTTAKLQLAPTAREFWHGFDDAGWRAKSPVTEVEIPARFVELLLVSVRICGGLLWLIA